MPKTIISALISIAAGFIFAPAAVHAQPVIAWADYYTDHWYDNPFGQNGLHHVVCGYVEGDETLTVKATDGSNTLALTRKGNWHCRFVEEEGLKFPGSLTIMAEDRSGKSQRATNLLDHIIPMAPAREISISAGGIAPTVSWAKDSSAQRYYVRILNSADVEIHRSPPLESPRYQIPAGLMTDGDIYYFRILIQNYDHCSVYEWGRCLENRSSTWVRFSPANNLKP